MSEPKEFKPLTAEEILVMQSISAAEAPYNQRAQALLALNEGKPQEEAAEASGLRPTQVKYWAARYRNNGLAVFPDELTAVEAEVIAEIAPEEMVEVVDIEEVVEKAAVAPENPAPVAKKGNKKKDTSKKEKPKGKKVKKMKKDKKKKSGKKSKKNKKSTKPQKANKNKKKKKSKKEKSKKKK